MIKIGLQAGCPLFCGPEIYIKPKNRSSPNKSGSVSRVGGIGD
jgi:hypothetical protein